MISYKALAKYFICWYKSTQKVVIIIIIFEYNYKTAEKQTLTVWNMYQSLWNILLEVDRPFLIVTSDVFYFPWLRMLYQDLLKLKVQDHRSRVLTLQNISLLSRKKHLVYPDTGTKMFQNIDPKSNNKRTTWICKPRWIMYDKLGWWGTIILIALYHQKWQGKFARKKHKYVIEMPSVGISRAGPCITHLMIKFVHKE